MVSEATVQAVLGVLRVALPRLMACYLFGSAARGDDAPGSDLDIGLLLAAGDTVPDYLGLVARLSDAAGRQVDLVDLRQAGDFLRMEVLRTGRALYVADPGRVLAWEAESMSDYAHHRERIRGILDDFQRTGVGYVVDGRRTIPF